MQRLQHLTLAGDIDAARELLREAQRRDDIESQYVAYDALVNIGEWQQALAWYEEQADAFVCSVCGDRRVKYRKHRVIPHTKVEERCECPPQPTHRLANAVARVAALTQRFRDVGDNHEEADGPNGEGCYPWEAKWCPQCGTCTCGGENDWVVSANCPLHGTLSPHANPPDARRVFELWVRCLRLWWPVGWWRWLRNAVVHEEWSRPPYGGLVHMNGGGIIVDDGAVRWGENAPYVPPLPPTPECVCIAAGAALGTCPGVDPNEYPCAEECEGAGTIWGLYGQTWDRCPTCNGSGRCPRCHGGQT